MLNRFLLLLVGAFLIQISCGQTVKGYRTSIGSGTDKISVVVVHGSPYEMGRAIGKLMQVEIQACMSTFLSTAESMLPERFNAAALDSAWTAVTPYVQNHFKEELRGVADGANVDLKTLQRAHAIPLLGDYACSGVMVWGAASANKHLYQIRNLDFIMEGHLQDYPLIIVYNPDQGIPHVVPTFAGYIAAHTGMNAQGIVLGEKGASPKTEFPYDLDGTHFSTLFRDLLYGANTLDEVLTTIKSTKLIKRYYLYVSDGKEPTRGAAKIRVSTPDSIKLTIWKDNDPQDEVAPAVLENAIYYTMKNDVAFEHLTKNNGKYDSDKMIELSRAVADEGGNLVNVVYDATSLEMWIAFAEEKIDASQRSYIHFKLKDFLVK